MIPRKPPMAAGTTRLTIRLHDLVAGKPKKPRISCCLLVVSRRRTVRMHHFGGSGKKTHRLAVAMKQPRLLRIKSAGADPGTRAIVDRPENCLLGSRFAQASGSAGICARKSR